MGIVRDEKYPPGWLNDFMAFERARGRSTDEPEKNCTHCHLDIKFPYRALCRECELKFGDFLIEDWPRCADCFFAFGNALALGYWVEPSRDNGNICQFCLWRREGLSIEEMLRTIARECGCGHRFVIRLNLDMTRPARGRFRITRDEAIRRIANGAYYHRALIEMLKHQRCSVERASTVFLRIAQTVVEAVEAENRPPLRRPSLPTDLTIEALARALGAATQLGHRWRALCPSHDDSHPSLDIEVGNSQPIIFTCRAGCQNREVIAGMKIRGLWPLTAAGRRVSA